MRRRTVHCAFAVAASLCALALAVQGLRLKHAVQINDAIAAAAAGRAPAATGTSTTPAAAGVDRRIVLARAAALSKAGDSDAALRGFDTLLVRGAVDDVARAALFDLGNLYLRQGLREPGNAAVFLPMLELAKQKYRDLLRADPSDWDARFNLERALRLAPEDAEAFEQPDDRPVSRPPNKLPDVLAPDLP